MKKWIAVLLSLCLVVTAAVGMAISASAEESESYAAYLAAQDSCWAVNSYDETTCTSATITGDGTYTVSVTYSNTYNSSDTWEKMNIIIFQPYEEGANLYTADTVTIDSVVIGTSTTLTNVSFTVTTGWYQSSSGDWPYGACLSLDTSGFVALNIGETLTVTFTITSAATEATDATEATEATEASEEATDETGEATEATEATEETEAASEASEEATEEATTATPTGGGWVTLSTATDDDGYTYYDLSSYAGNYSYIRVTFAEAIDAGSSGGCYGFTGGDISWDQSTYWYSNGETTSDLSDVSSLNSATRLYIQVWWGDAEITSVSVYVNSGVPITADPTLLAPVAALLVVSAVGIAVLGRKRYKL